MRIKSLFRVVGPDLVNLEVLHCLPKNVGVAKILLTPNILKFISIRIKTISIKTRKDFGNNTYRRGRWSMINK